MGIVDNNQQNNVMQAVAYLGLQYRKKGEELIVRCPFHTDKTPSMGIRLSTGVYHCFSCNRSGTIGNLFYELTGQSMNKVLGIKSDPFSRFSFNTLNGIGLNDSLEKKAVNLSVDFSNMQSPYMNDLCSEYIRVRGITTHVVRKYGLRYAENMHINGTWFRKRLMIPVYEDGKIISFEGRRLIDDGSPKVLYPKDCTVNTLFDLDNLDRDNTLYVVEGLMDLFVLKACSVFVNSTSIFGACLTNRQQELITQFKKVVFIPDSDEPGQKPLEIMREKNLSNIYVLRLPKKVKGKEIKDVGDLPKIGSSVQELIDKNWLSYEEVLT